MKKACDVPGKIGNPKSSADLNSGQQQPQENGNQKTENGRNIRCADSSYRAKNNGCSMAEHNDRHIRLINIRLINM